MSLPSFVQLMASLGLQDTPALPRARHHRTASSSSSYSASTSTAHAFSPWSSDPSVQTLVCPQPDASNPATADSQHSITSTLSYSSQSSFRSSNAAPSPAIVVSAAEPSPISHHANWDSERERERERALTNPKKSPRYAPYNADSRDVFTTRRGSLPGTADEMSDILHDGNHHRSPSPPQSLTSRPPSNRVSPVRPTFAGHSQTPSQDSDVFTVDGPQPNLSTLRQSQPRISRRARCARARGHLRTASNPLVSPSRPRGRAVNMLLEPDMSNTSPVASISSLLRKSDHSYGYLQTGSGAAATAPASAPSSALPYVTTFSFNGPASAIPAGLNPQSSSPAPQGKYMSNNTLWAEGNTRSFSQRPRRIGARTEPPAPLTIPTLPSSFAIPPIPSLPPIPHTSGGSYVSRRDCHSADGPRRRSPVWRSRKSTSPPVQPATLEVAMES